MSRSLSALVCIVLLSKLVAVEFGGGGHDEQESAHPATNSNWSSVTLIIGYASDEFAILVSDRMIEWTMPDGSKRYQEQVCKAVSFVGQYLFGFTGAAGIGGDTSTWLVEELVALVNKQPPEGIANHLIKSLSRDIDGQGIALLSVGYANQPDADGQLAAGTPRLDVISNATRDKFGSWTVGSKFRVFQPTLAVRGHAFRLWAVGSPPPKARLMSAGEKIRRYRRHHPDRCREIVKEMALVIVERSHETPGVGPTVQVIIMPRASWGKETVSTTLSFSEPLTEVTSLEFNPREDESGLALINGHALVCSNGMAFRDFVISPGRTEEIGPRPPFIPPPRPHLHGS